jgi:hypothetical protein
MSTWNPSVSQFTDGTSQVNASTVNNVVNQLAARDEYLFEMLNNQSDKTVMISFNQPIVEGLIPGTPVFFDNSAGQAVLKSAKAGYDSGIGGHLIPKTSAFVFGIIGNVYSNQSNPVVYGDIYLRGLIDGNDASRPINFNDLLDAQSSLQGIAPGPLYLSSTEAGKLSIYATGASIFIGYYIGSNKVVLAPNIDSLNQLYFNYKVFLKSTPCGTATNTSGTLWSITHNVSAAADMTSTVGWVNASDAATVLSLTPPSGAAFYYNLPSDAAINASGSGLTTEQQQHALQLKNALPANPAAYTMLFVNGILQTQYDTDHTDGSYIINENGIWWMVNQTNYVPWAGSPGNVEIQLLITKLNPDFADSVVTSLESSNSALVVTGSDGQAAAHGNLTIELALPIVNVNTTGNGYTVQQLSYNSSSGITTAEVAPVVNTLSTGPGLSLTSTSPGQYSLSLNNFSLSGEVADIEPEEADYVYKGLHAYLRMKNPQPNQKLGFIGKLRIPASVPSGAKLNIQLVCFCDAATTQPGSTANFSFEYSVSNNGTAISSSTTSATVGVAGTVLAPALTQVTLYKNGSTPYFSIPSSAFSANSYVNFRISRVNSTYTNPISVIGVLWAIE